MKKFHRYFNAERVKYQLQIRIIKICETVQLISKQFNLPFVQGSLYCSHCGAVIDEDEDYETIDGEVVCTDCVEQHTTTCDRCGAIIWTNDSYGDDYTTLCSHCYHNHYCSTYSVGMPELMISSRSCGK